MEKVTEKILATTDNSIHPPTTQNSIHENENQGGYHINVQRYGIKILVKEDGPNIVPVGQIKFPLPIEKVIVSVENTAVTTDELEKESTLSNSEETTIPLLEIETTTPRVVETETKVVDTVDVRGDEEQSVEELPVSYIAPPMIAIVPTIDSVDEKEIVSGIMQIKEDAITAIDYIISEEEDDSLSLADCSAPLEDIKEMLSSLALNVAKSSPILSEILTTGGSLKDIEDPEELVRGGAKILILLEPFLNNLLPATQVSDCASEDSAHMLMSFSNVATKLDILANAREQKEDSDRLHRIATSLQLAAWVMAQLQKSVHTFYKPEILCGEGKSSELHILDSLTKAMAEYMPILNMMGSQDAANGLADTIASIERARDEIADVGVNNGLEELPGVECGAPFSVMGRSLQNLANFVKGLPA